MAHEPLSDVPIHYVAEAASTMELARELFLQRGKEAVAVVAGHQLEGRGRGVSRRWHDAPGTSLLMTLTFSSTLLTCPVSQIPLRTGLGIAEYLRTLVPAAEILIKWPNDLLCGEKKICGVLCETSREAVSVGIGLNVRRQSFSGDAGKRPPISIEELGLILEDPREAARDVLRFLEEAFSITDWREPLQSRLYKFGRQVRFIPGRAGEERPAAVGVIVGVDEFGGLLIREDETGITRIWYAGELK